MTEAEHKKIEALQEQRVFSIAAPVILPLIERRKRIALEQLMSEFKQGQTNNLAKIAEITCLSDLEREIIMKQNQPMERAK